MASPGKKQADCGGGDRILSRERTLAMAVAIASLARTERAQSGSGNRISGIEPTEFSADDRILDGNELNKLVVMVVASKARANRAG